jgi:hypothetical protein
MIPDISAGLSRLEDKIARRIIFVAAALLGGATTLPINHRPAALCRYVFNEVFDLKPTSQTTGRIRFFTR